MANVMIGETEVTGDLDVSGTVTAAQLVGGGAGITGLSVTTASDATFRIQDNGDATKQIAFQASDIGTGTTRTITMPNTDVNLGDIATNNAKVSNATHTGQVTGSTVLTIASGAVGISKLSATGTPDATTFLRGDNTWATPAGAGDMSLAGTQTVTGAKTFEDATLILEGSSSGTTTLKTNATAGTTTATFQAATGTVAYTADIPTDTDDLSEGTTNKYMTAAEKTKVGYINVTQAVNLDAMETDIATLLGGPTLGEFSDTAFAIVDDGDNTKRGLFQASGITTATDRTYTLPDASGTMALTSDITVTASSTTTFTNKRTTRRTGTTTSHATPTINTDNVDLYIITAQAADITSMTTNLSGTPNTGDELWIWITGTAARAITWGASFASGPGTLPTTTVTTKQLWTHFIYDGSIWRCVATGSNP